MSRKGTTKFSIGKGNLPIFISGNRKLAELLDIQDKNKLQQLRTKGLPYYTEGKLYMYNVQEVVTWYANYLHSLPKVKF